MKVELTDYFKNPTMSIEKAACNCYNSKPTDNGRIMKGCISNGHTSVTEFATFTFHISGVSRALLAQLTRHRHAGYAVRSQRYCSEDNFEYVIPKSVKNDDNAERVYKCIMEELNDIYSLLQEQGVPNEDARYILPNACFTELEMTINFRSLMNFMHERLCTRAQWEIRELAKLMRNVVIEVMPEAENYLVPKCEMGKVKYCPEMPSQSCGRQPLAKDINRLIENSKRNAIQEEF